MRCVIEDIDLIDDRLCLEQGHVLVVYIPAAIALSDITLNDNRAHLLVVVEPFRMASYINEAMRMTQAEDEWQDVRTSGTDVLTILMHRRLPASSGEYRRLFREGDDPISSAQDIKRALT